MRKLVKMGAASLGGTFLLIAIAVSGSNRSKVYAPSPVIAETPQQVAERRAKWDADRKRTEAKSDALALLKTKMLSPASTVELKSQVVDEDHDPQRGDRYVVHEVVDSKNAFGVPLRGSYCVVLKLEGDNYRFWPKSVGKCENPPTHDEIVGAEFSNGWVNKGELAKITAEALAEQATRDAKKASRKQARASAPREAAVAPLAAPPVAPALVVPPKKAAADVMDPY